MKKGILTVLVFVISIGILVTTGCRKPNQSKADYIINKIAGKLDLSDEQFEWLEGFKIDLKEEFHQVKQERETVRENLKNSFIAGVLTEEMLTESIANRCDLIIEKAPVFSKLLTEFHTNLTPKQRTKLVELLNEFQEKKEKWKKTCRFFTDDGPDLEKLVAHITEKVEAELYFSDEQNEWLDGFTADIIEDPVIKDLMIEVPLIKKYVLSKVTDEFVNDLFDTEMITELIINNLPIEKIKDLPIPSKVMEIQTNLTPEQRVKLVSMINKHKEKRKGCFFKRQCFFKK